MTEVHAPVTYKTACVWCFEHRKGLPVNYVAVEVPNSSGICPDCSAVLYAQIRKRRAELEAK